MLYWYKSTKTDAAHQRSDLIHATEEDEHIAALALRVLVINTLEESEVRLSLEGLRLRARQFGGCDSGVFAVKNEIFQYLM